MRKWLAWSLVALTLLGLSGCKADETQPVPELLEPVGMQMDIAEVKCSDIQDITVYDGEIVPHVEELQFQTDGVVEEVYVELGQKVEKGQILVTLSEKNTLEQVEKIEAEIAEIRKQGQFSDRLANADIGIAQNELKKLRAEGASEQSCQLKQIQIEELQLSLKQTQELRQLQIDEKQRLLDLQKEKLGKNQLLAPCDGTVVYNTEVQQVGNSVRANTTVMCIADDSRLYLETEYIREEVFDATQKAYVRIKNKDYSISYIPYSQEEYLELSLKGGEIQSRFTVDAKEGEIEAGEYGALILVDHFKENVLTIPANALFSDAAGRYVYKIVDGQRVRCPVTVGTMTKTLLEITEGLQEGDQVYVED